LGYLDKKQLKALRDDMILEIKSEFDKEMWPDEYGNPGSVRYPMSFIHQGQVAKDALEFDNISNSYIASFTPASGRKFMTWSSGEAEEEAIDFETQDIVLTPNIRASFCSNFYDTQNIKIWGYNTLVLFHEMGHIFGVPSYKWSQVSFCKCSSFNVNIENTVVSIENLSEKERLLRYKKMLKKVRLEHIDLKDKDDDFIKKHPVLNHFFNIDHLSNDLKIDDLMADIMSINIYMEICRSKEVSEEQCVKSLMAILNEMGSGDSVDHYHTLVRKVWAFVINPKLYKYFKDWIRGNPLDKEYNEFLNKEKKKENKEKKKKENILWTDTLLIWRNFGTAVKNNSAFRRYFKKHFRRLNDLETDKIMEIFRNYIAKDQNATKQSKLENFKKIVENRAQHIDPNDKFYDENNKNYEKTMNLFFIEKDKYNNLIKILTFEIKNLSNGGKRKTKKNQKNKKLSNGGKRKTKKNKKSK
jgi:hypothetical protein